MSGTKKALIGLGVILLVLVLAVGGIALGVRHAINSQIQHVPVTLDPSQIGAQSGESGSQSDQQDTGQLNFLILGSDSRESGGDPSDWQYGAGRSDVMMLVQLSGDRKSVNVMSIPRDSWVSIPGYGEAKVNAAYSFGGASLTIQTVQDLTGVGIDHFAVVDFTSFEQMTDALGSVTIDTVDGPQTMNGAEALAFVRERKSLPHGDFDRVRRQQAWIQAIMSRVFEKDVLTSPQKVGQLAQILLAHSAVDEGLDVDSMVSLGLSLKDLRGPGVTFFTAPYTGTGTSADGQSIVVLDDSALASLMDAWRKDDVKDYVANDPDIQSLKSGAVS